MVFVDTFEGVPKYIFLPLDTTLLLREWTDKDSVLSMVRQMMPHGWEHQVNTEFKATKQSHFSMQGLKDALPALKETRVFSLLMSKMVLCM